MSKENATENLTPPAEEETPKTLLTEEPKTEEAVEEKSEDKPAPAEEVVPLTTEDITIPEGLEINPTLVEEFLGVVNNTELSPKERAQALVDLQVNAMREASEASSKTWSDLNNQWRDEVKADPEFAGEKLQPALGRIGRLLSEYGSEQALEALDITGAGNNPHIIKLLHNIAGKLVEGEPAFGSPKTTEASAAQRLFPSMKG